MQKPTHFLNLFQMLLLLGFWGHVVLEGLVKRHVLLVDCSEADALGPGVNIGVIFSPQVPWEDLRYLFGEIMYGGHITDDWDRKLCRVYLEEFMNPSLVRHLIHFMEEKILIIF